MTKDVYSAHSSSGTTLQVGPVFGHERINIVDVLRGWAIFGMLVVNLSHDLPWVILFAKHWPGTTDRVAYYLVTFFANGKFYTLFSFLFGWGFTMQMARAEARGVRFFPLYARRLFVLLLFGLAYKIFGPYDQLIIYALLGYVLFLFRRVSLTTVLVCAVLCFSGVAVYHIRAEGAQENHPAPSQVQSAAESAASESEIRLHAHGSVAAIVASHLRELAADLSSSDYYVSMFGYEFPLLLLGLYVGRRRILQNVSSHLPFIRKVFWWSLALGVVGNAVSTALTAYPGSAAPNRTAPWLLAEGIGDPALCFFYASVIVLLAQNATWKSQLCYLAPVGRMALSNYLFQGFVFVMLFYSYGLGLYGRMGPALGVALSIPIFLLQVLMSTWWMGRFRFGPAEWLWRTLTYGKLQPMRLPARAVSAPA